MSFQAIVEWAAQLFEVAGVLSMMGGLAVALVLTFRQRRDPGSAVVRDFRHRLGRGIVLGLEFLVAADILRTMKGEPTPRGVVALGVVVLIRTFLSFTLEVELDGRWPWQRRRPEEGPRPA